MSIIRKILKIESCFYCRFYDHRHHACLWEKKAIPDKHSVPDIPEWCHLPDAPEVKK